MPLLPRSSEQSLNSECSGEEIGLSLPKTCFRGREVTHNCTIAPARLLIHDQGELSEAPVFLMWLENQCALYLMGAGAIPPPPALTRSYRGQ